MDPEWFFSPDANTKENNAQNNKGNRYYEEIHSTIAFEQTDNSYCSI